MELAFYGSSVVAILATLGVITGTNPMHALLYLIVSLIAVGMIFFSLGASFVGAMQVIVYAGAIMVLLVFVVMMLTMAQTDHLDWPDPAQRRSDGGLLHRLAWYSRCYHWRTDDSETGRNWSLRPLCTGG